MEYFNKEFCLEVWGDYACFTRPEMKVERVSYDVMTPSSARSIFEAIFWKPAIRWNVKKIEVLNPIKWISVRRNEVGAVMSDRVGQLYIEDNRQQKAGLLLRDVRYRIYAELEYINPKKRESKYPVLAEIEDMQEAELMRKDENPGKYNAMFERRAKKGQCFNQPYLGCREFTANFKLVDTSSHIRPIEEDRELGFMLYDMDYTIPNDPKAMFFRATLANGTLNVPPLNSEEVRR